MAEPATPQIPLESEIQYVEQELEAASRKWNDLTNALNQLRQTGDSHDEIDDRLEDKKIVRQRVGWLQQRLSDLQKQLSNKRDLEHAWQLNDAKRQRLELEREERQGVYILSSKLLQTDQRMFSGVVPADPSRAIDQRTDGKWTR